MATKKATRKQRATIDPNESKEAKFVRLATKRVNKALNDIRLVGNLARYSHSPQAAEQIMGALAGAVEEVGAAFSTTKSKERGTFSL